VPLCPADLGSTPLPRFRQSVDISDAGGNPDGPLSGAGRLWYSVMDGEGAPHVAGVDTATGDRLVIPAPNGTRVNDVAGSRVWSVEQETNGVTVHDARTGALVRRYDSGRLTHDGIELTLISAQADAAGGGWLLGAPLSGNENFRAVVRVRPDGGVAWTRRVDVHRYLGSSPGRGYHLAEHGGTAYVAVAEPGTTEFWRLDAAGEITAHRTVPNDSPHFASVLLAATADGLYALAPDGAASTRLIALHPSTLAVRASMPWHGAFDLFTGDDGVFVAGEVCSFNLARYDPVTMERTGFWRTERPEEGVEGTLHNGAVWMLYAPEAVPVALHRYDLP
jgi:hypothetical protein